MNDFEIEHSADFDQVYDLDDPLPYYAHLAACDYRMPAHLSDWLRTNCDVGSSPLNVLDLACGYGFNGALLRHELELADVYALYASRPWSPADGRANWERDAAFFAGVRATSSEFNIAGLDIAPVAIEYSLATGLIDRGFTDDLVAEPASDALADHLRTIDVVIESGAIGAIYAGCFAGILDAVDATRAPHDRPWFVYCPRPTVDRRPVESLWRRRGYQSEPCSPLLRYRQPIGELEAQMVIDETTAAGNDPATAIVDGYLAVEMRVARPTGPSIG